MGLIAVTGGYRISPKFVHHGSIEDNMSNVKGDPRPHYFSAMKIQKVSGPSRIDYLFATNNSILRLVDSVSTSI